MIVASDLLSRSASWTLFVHTWQDKPCLASGIQVLPHPAAPLLANLRVDGAPVKFTTPDWTHPRISEALKRGSHPSAKQYLHFLETEMADMVDKRYWVVLPYELVKDLPHLRLSPIGVVPQRNRRPHTIVDYTWSHVNSETSHMAPNKAMQFG